MKHVGAQIESASECVDDVAILTAHAQINRFVCEEKRFSVFNKYK